VCRAGARNSDIWIPLNHICLESIKRKGGIRARRFIAATSERYRENLRCLFGVHAIALLVMASVPGIGPGTGYNLSLD